MTAEPEPELVNNLHYHFHYELPLSAITPQLHHVFQTIVYHRKMKNEKRAGELMHVFYFEHTKMGVPFNDFRYLPFSFIFDEYGFNFTERCTGYKCKRLNYNYCYGKAIAECDQKHEISWQPGPEQMYLKSLFYHGEFSFFELSSMPERKALSWFLSVENTGRLSETLVTQLRTRFEYLIKNNLNPECSFDYEYITTDFTKEPLHFKNKSMFLIFLQSWNEIIDETNPEDSDKIRQLVINGPTDDYNNWDMIWEDSTAFNVICDGFDINNQVIKLPLPFVYKMEYLSTIYKKVTIEIGFGDIDSELRKDVWIEAVLEALCTYLPDDPFVLLWDAQQTVFSWLIILRGELNQTQKADRNKWWCVYLKCLALLDLMWLKTRNYEIEENLSIHAILQVKCFKAGETEMVDYIHFFFVTRWCYLILVLDGEQLYHTQWEKAFIDSNQRVFNMCKCITD